jgi:hypothetical protein
MLSTALSAAPLLLLFNLVAVTLLSIDGDDHADGNHEYRRHLHLRAPATHPRSARSIRRLDPRESLTGQRIVIRWPVAVLRIRAADAVS